MKNFKEMGIAEPILKTIEEQYFTEPTSIQAQTIPLVINRKDVIAGSKTGSGKTLIFSCGIIQNAMPGNGIQALVLVPTRELAGQVAKAFKKFSKYKPLSITTVYGGVAINPQIRDLQTTDIVIGTPGRILDHLNRRTINLRQVKTLVLDEADMMLDMGFLPDVEKIIKYTPRTRQTLLFSATITDEVHYLTNRYMEHPIKVSTEEYVDQSKLEQVYFDVTNKQKFSLLVHLLQEEKEGLVMIFCNTRENTDFIAKNLKVNGIKSCAIHGGLAQNKRNQILEDFHKGRVSVLVCTDVAARGLDIKGVSHIYNYDTCREAKQYIHRIGRTARAGKEGKAITLLAKRDHDNFSRVLATNDVTITSQTRPRIERAKIVFKTAPRHNRFNNERRRHSRSGVGRRNSSRPNSWGRNSSRSNGSRPNNSRPNERRRNNFRSREKISNFKTP